MSPRRIGKVMTGRPVTSAGAQDRVRSCPAPAALAEQRRRSTLLSYAIQRRADRQRVSRERRRLTGALLLSLLFHTLLLSLTFGGQGLWLPGFTFPWQDRRAEVPDLRVELVPAQVTTAEPAVTPVAEPIPQALVEQPVARGSALRLSVPRAPPTRRTEAAIAPEAEPRAEAGPMSGATTGAGAGAGGGGASVLLQPTSAAAPSAESVASFNIERFLRSVMSPSPVCFGRKTRL
jgi:hypothetical protein